MNRTALLAALALPLAAASAAQDDAGLDRVTADLLKGEVDYSLRWLRGEQDRASGGYGSVEATAWVVRAFRESPRAYSVADGPFLFDAVAYLGGLQREDGSVRADGADEPAATASTLAVLAALDGVDEEPAASIARRARLFLGLEAVAFAGPPRPAADDARALAAQLLGTRDDAGHWGGSVLGTARNVWLLSGCAAALKGGDGGAATASPLPDFAAADRARAVRAIERGAAFLAENPNDDGLWGALGETDPGITAMVVSALLAHPEPRPEGVQAAAERGLAYLRGLQKEDGSIHAGRLQNYVTSASVQALVRAGGEGDAERVARARAFLTELQADEGDGYGPEHRYYGGVGYGGDERPDLSNLQLALEALAAAGAEPGDPTFEKALVFLQRTQNRSESNDLVVTEGGAQIVPGDDGGAGYAPGESKAGTVELPDGSRVTRSYGSMTYALLRGYLFAGLAKDDPRVAAAWDWLREHYTLDVNPGFEASADPAAPYQGLFYYFYSMARALDLYGQEVVTDGAGVEHPWREELAGRLVAMQRPDGSWVNDNSPRWWEGNPVLATAYAALALDATAGEAR